MRFPTPFQKPTNLLLLVAALGGDLRPAAARPPEVWFAPADNIMQQNEDFPLLFEHPESWATSANQVFIMEVNGNWLLQAPAALVAQGLAVLRAAGIKLAVSIPAMPADKTQCGDAIEGMIWPGEAALYAQGLKARGADVYAFALDLPLTSGHLSRDPTACRFSIAETANRLAATVRELRDVYPDAKIIDEEVPTGMPVPVWTDTLQAWLTAYRRATGTDLDGFTMDVWWESPWRETVTATVAILDRRGVSAGIFVDSDGDRQMSAAEWIADAKGNACRMKALDPPVAYAVITNWSNMEVHNGPEADSNSLAGLLKWYLSGRPCH